MLYATMKRKYQENADLINSAEGLTNIFTDYKYHSKYVTKSEIPKANVKFLRTKVEGRGDEFVKSEV